MLWPLGYIASLFYVVVTPDVSLMQPNGLRFAYPDDGNVKLVGYHYNINKPLDGVQAAEFNVDVTVVTSGLFIHENTDLHLTSGDQVNYWVNVITDNNGGYTKVDMTWTVPEPVMSTLPPPSSSTVTPVSSTVQPLAPSTIHPTQPQSTVEPPSTGNSAPSGCNAYPCATSCDQTVAPCNGLIFEELWDELDMERWQHELTMGGGGNWEFQIYTNNRSNSYVRDNTLFLKPTLTADHYGESFLSSGSLDIWGGSPADQCTGNAFYGCSRVGTGTNYINPVQSARIRSVNSFAFKYGRIEVEAKMPTGDWIWPAIWMLPKTNSYGQWPASGEFDILESRGNPDLRDADGISHGNDAIGSTMHWGPYWPLNGYAKTTKEKHGSFASEFHKYTLDWQEDLITFYVDDEELMKVDPGHDGFWSFGEFDNIAPGSDNPWKHSKSRMAPFDQEFYLVMNVAVGGTNGYFQDAWSNGNGAKPWNNNSPTAMRDFWNAKNSWYPTWQADKEDGENAALQVKSIRVWKN